MEFFKSGDNSDTPNHFKNTNLVLSLQVEVSFEVLPHHRVVLEMQLPLTLHFELLLNHRQQIPLLHQPIHSDLVVRRGKQTLLEDAELEQLQLFLRPQKKSEIVTKRQGVKSSHLPPRFFHSLHNFLKGVEPGNIISETFLLDNFKVFHLDLLVQQDIVPHYLLRQFLVEQLAILWL